ncbi:MAG: hypothetical protein IJJ26_08550 [Victivallales bacterium]|nr:hypothetical protein [Victivallales bacterium]
MPSNPVSKKYFLGDSDCTLDPQRRILLPKNWRSGEEGESFFIVPSTGKTLKVVRPEDFDRIVEETMAMNISDEENGSGAMAIGSLSALVTPDKQGRVALTQGLVEYAGLKSRVSIVGSLGFGRILDYDTWQMEKGRAKDMIPALEKNTYRKRELQNYQHLN